MQSVPALVSPQQLEASQNYTVDKAKINQTTNVRGTGKRDVNSGAANITNIPVSRTSECLSMQEKHKRWG